MAINHKEFYVRVFKRLDKLQSSLHKERKSSEAKKLEDILKFFKEDTRVIDDAIPSKESTSEEKKDLENENIESEKVNIKNEKGKDMPQVKVEISEEFSMYLKNGTIKEEPKDSDNQISPQQSDEIKERETEEAEKKKGKKER